MAAMVVLAIAASGVLLPFSSSAAVRSEGTHRALAARLACDLTEQIICEDFDDIISTYDGYTEKQGKVKDAQGKIFTDSIYANYSRQVKCTKVYMAGQSEDFQANFILIEVSVFYKGGQAAQVSRLVSNNF